jgi:hypothetical protein
MNASNIALSTVASALMAEALVVLHTNVWMALGCAIVGIICWVGYDYLP